MVFAGGRRQEHRLVRRKNECRPNTPSTATDRGLEKAAPRTCNLLSDQIAEICRLFEFLLFIKIITGANTESAVASGIPSAQTITDSSSPTPPHSAAEARSSPRTLTRRTQPLLFCAAPFRQLPAPQSAIAVRPPR